MCVIVYVCLKLNSKHPRKEIQVCNIHQTCNVLNKGAKHLSSRVSVLKQKRKKEGK